MSKEFLSDLELRSKLISGANKLAEAVSTTLGPRGKNVLLHKKGQNPCITKDGVTVSEFFDLQDPFENAGVKIIKQASSTTNTEAGDGTTTATVLACKILNNGQRYITSGVSPYKIKKGIEVAVEKVIEYLDNISVPLTSMEQIKQIATISSNGDNIIGDLISTAVEQVGKNGSISIKEARSLETTLEIVEGFRFDSGYISAEFINDERKSSVKFDDCFLLVTDYKMEHLQELMPILEMVARDGRPLLIVADSIEGQLLAALIMNKLKGSIKVAAVKAPMYGEERKAALEDIALSTGATLISRESDKRIRDAVLADLGTAKTVDITKFSTVIVDGGGDYAAIEKRIDGLKQQLSQTESEYECKKIQERVTRLVSSIGIIYVGAPTEVEMIEKKYRIEDALEAVKSAQQDGIVAGGGIALAKSRCNIKVKVEDEEEAIGAKVLLDSLSSPLRIIVKNGGDSCDLIEKKVISKKDINFGYNAMNGKYVDMFEAGIIDPARVTKTALKNAASAAGILLTTGYAIIEE